MDDESENESDTVQNQLIRAARDLMCAVYDSGPDFVLLMDRRRMYTRVQQDSDGLFVVAWQLDDGDDAWETHRRHFENLREATFHAYQGPH